MKILIALTGASGAIYADLLLKELQKDPQIELFVTASANAQRIFHEERGLHLKDLDLPLFSTKDFDVPYVSGSARMDAMVVVPCSMGTLGRIAHGISDDAITRAADVFLKEKRKLILVPRETPLNTIALQNMLTLSQAGATLLPAMPAYYGLPQSIDEAAFTVVSRILDHLGIDHKASHRWHEK
jgi:4-hydroxy-3-polyprenylbenzoate decarboxylase